MAIPTLFSTAAFPVTANVADDPDDGIGLYSSDYLNSYNVFAQKGASSGKLDITYVVIAPARMSKIGASKIEIYRDLNTKVATFYGSTANRLQDSNTGTHGGTYTYSGTAGVAYYAKVTVFASDANGSDSRTIITNSVVV